MWLVVMFFSVVLARALHSVSMIAILSICGAGAVFWPSGEGLLSCAARNIKCGRRALALCHNWRARPERIATRMRASTIAIVAATIIVLIITLAAIVAAIGLARMRKYYVKFSNVWTKRAKISDLYEDLKTGDIILFASLVHNPTNSMVTGTFFSHSAIVVRREGRMYLSETGPGNYVDIPGAAAKGPGACLSPLLARLRYYTGKCYVMRLSRELDRDREESVQRAVDSTLASEYPYPTPLQMLIGFFRGGVDDHTALLPACGACAGQGGPGANRRQTAARYGLSRYLQPNLRALRGPIAGRIQIQRPHRDCL
jgi:hypothetical protein